MAAKKKQAKDEHGLDAVDYKVLTMLDTNGPMFMKHPAHEHRAWSMVKPGYTEKKNEVSDMRYEGGQQVVTYRWLYTITTLGRGLVKKK